MGDRGGLSGYGGRVSPGGRSRLAELYTKGVGDGQAQKGG